MLNFGLAFQKNVLIIYKNLNKYNVDQDFGARGSRLIFNIYVITELFEKEIKYTCMYIYIYIKSVFCLESFKFVWFILFKKLIRYSFINLL